IISKISTGTGDTGTSDGPSGLAKISAFNLETTGNKAGFVYGGDLLGNVWRFDINSPLDASAAGGIGTGAVLKFATLLSPSGISQPITTTPVLGNVAGKNVVFVGTGKYLETSDLSNTQKQTQYAIKDDGTTTTLINARASLVQQTLSTTLTNTRTSSEATVDFLSQRGWYFDFPVSGERVNIDSQLIQGVLLIPSIVPSSSICTPGGFGWLNFVDYKTGTAVTTIAGTRADSPIVGVNVLYIEGKPIVSLVTSNKPTPSQPAIQPDFSKTASGFTGKRVIWRELIP
ncbi:MAG: PilC/PilY family type IV pilus protein, partial [Candidatus Nitrotoga sp.]